MDKKLHLKLNKRETENNLRKLDCFQGMIDFISNDYLGLSKVKANCLSSGATGSRLITGNSVEVEAAESILADFFNWEDALCFNSGYDANLSLFSTIPQKGDIILYDQFIHASVRDGIRLSLAKSYSFQHNDLADVERLLSKHKDQTIYIAVESLYSMDGDFCPLAKLVELTKKYNAYLIVDEAHSCGVFGEQGRGLTNELNLDADIFIKLVTFGKAYGGHGAVVLCEKDMKKFLINFARPFIFSTALPVSSYQFMSTIVFNKSIEKAKNRLIKNITFFRTLIQSDELSSDAKSPIQILRKNKMEELTVIENNASWTNIGLKVIKSPTVAVGSECIRVCLHAFNTEEEIVLLAEIINKKPLNVRA